jgi:hypothetical protein
MAPRSRKVVLGWILAAGLVGCARRAPVAADAAAASPPRVEAPPLVDAGADRPRDARPDGPAAGTGGAPGHHHLHHAAAPRSEPAGGLQVRGGVGRAQVEAVLRGVRPRLDACIQKARAQQADLKGKVTFRLSIDADGRVPLAEVLASTLGGGDPELCMVEKLRDLKFPASPGGAASTVTFPVTFGK